MFLADSWTDYEVIDTGDGEKLERWGRVILRRPDPQTIWPKADERLWKQAQAHYHRSDRGGGEWEFLQKLPERWWKEAISSRASLPKRPVLILLRPRLQTREVFSLIFMRA